MNRKNRMLRKLAEDQSGIALPVAIFMVVVVAIMGAGFLTFVVSDLGTAAENNRGQSAFGLAEAGRVAAEREIAEWAESCVPDEECDPEDDPDLAPWLADDGVTLEFEDGDVAGSATIEINPTPSTGGGHTLAVDSRGNFGSAQNNRRRVEAVYEFTPPEDTDGDDIDLCLDEPGVPPDGCPGEDISPGGISIPPVYFTRGDLRASGNSGTGGVSAFALGDARVTGTSSFGNIADRRFGKWAETSGAGSFPNSFNTTPRGSNLAGIGAQGTLTLTGAAEDNFAAGTRSFGSNTTPRVVPDPPANSSQISFPFDTTHRPEDIEILRQRALQLERDNPGTKYYYDGTPGDGTDNGEHGSDKNISTSTPNATRVPWPAGSTYETVVFFKYNSDNGKEVKWDIDAPCDDTTRRGVIVVENGDLRMSGSNGGFNGAVIIRAPVDPDDGTPVDPDEGTFRSSGSSCMNGYVNSTGNIDTTGSSAIVDVPALSSLPAFSENTGGDDPLGDGTDGDDIDLCPDDPGVPPDGCPGEDGGGVQLQSWREVYSAD